MARTLCLLALAALLLPPASEAGDAPSVSLNDDGSVNVELWVDASPEDVMATLSGPFERGELTSEVSSVRVLERRGDCRTLEIAVTIGPASFDYEVERCDEHDGTFESLTRSGLVTEHWARWSIQPDARGTLLHLTMRSELDLPIPAYVQQRQLGRSAGATVASLAKAAYALSH